MTRLPHGLERLLQALALALLLAPASTLARAQEGPPGASDAPAAKTKGGLRALLGKAGDKVREEAMKRFDKDGDGRLDDAERAEAMDALKKKGADMQAQLRQFMLRRFDADKDGTLDEQERKTAFEEVTKQLEQNGPMVKNTILGMVHRRFDADGDGTLDGKELGSARDELFKRIVQGAGNADAATTAPPVDPAERRRRSEEARKKEMLERFDADGDGTLDEDERGRAKEELKKLYDEFDAKTPSPVAE